jgi:hypothetical protein
MMRVTLTLALLGCVATWTAAQPQPGQPDKQKLPENVEKAKMVIADHLKEIKGEHGQIIWLDDKALAEMFPKQIFFAVRYRIYPVAVKLPEGMKPSNIFVVEGDKFKYLKDAKALEEFFRANLGPVKNVQTGMQSVSAWLKLSQEFVQDGFYTFETSKMGSNSDNWYELRAVVMKGGNGDITAKLEFAKDGKLVSATETVKVKPGPRPICQATKLLDADPVVRKMAEQDLLYMGLAARDYLMEQRAGASPELRQAIDRLWAQIVKNEW